MNWRAPVGVVHLDRPVRRIVWSRGAVRVQGVDSGGTPSSTRRVRPSSRCPWACCRRSRSHSSRGRRRFCRRRTDSPWAARFGWYWYSVRGSGGTPRGARNIPISKTVSSNWAFCSCLHRRRRRGGHRIRTPCRCSRRGPAVRRRKPGNVPSLRAGRRTRRCGRASRRWGAHSRCRSAELEQLLVAWYTHDWEHDEYARGAYSYVPAGALDAPDLMTAPVDGTLFFAGEHTDLEGHWGTVHAALASGARVAAGLLASPIVSLPRVHRDSTGHDSCDASNQ
jgi:hypothetical protein